MRNVWPKLGGVLGIVYCIAGFVLIFLGWNGTASNDREASQLPYVVSGGIAGLAVVVVGAALIVAHSLRSDRVELRGSIDDLRSAVERIGAGDNPAGVPARAAVGASATADTVVAGPHSYHRPDCRLVEAQADAVTMSSAEAQAGGREPCRVCNPDQAA